MPGVAVPGLVDTVYPAGIAAEFFSLRFDRERNRARSSHDGIWAPGVLTADVGAVEKPFEDSEFRDVPKAP